MSYMFPDQIEITPVTLDKTFGNKTSGTPFYSKARIQLKESISNGDNRENNYETIIFVPNKTPIHKGDFIQITKRNGSLVYLNKREVQEVFLIGDGFGDVEVRIR